MARGWFASLDGILCGAKGSVKLNLMRALDALAADEARRDVEVERFDEAGFEPLKRDRAHHRIVGAQPHRRNDEPHLSLR